MKTYNLKFTFMYSVLIASVYVQCEEWFQSRIVDMQYMRLVSHSLDILFYVSGDFSSMEPLVHICN